LTEVAGNEKKRNLLHQEGLHQKFQKYPVRNDPFPSFPPYR